MGQALPKRDLKVLFVMWRIAIAKNAIMQLDGSMNECSLGDCSLGIILYEDVLKLSSDIAHEALINIAHLYYFKHLIIKPHVCFLFLSSKLVFGMIWSYLSKLRYDPSSKPVI
jgi:hypothetical protein